MRWTTGKLFQITFLALILCAMAPSTASAEFIFKVKVDGVRYIPEVGYWHFRFVTASPGSGSSGIENHGFVESCPEGGRIVDATSFRFDPNTGSDYTQSVHYDMAFDSEPWSGYATYPDPASLVLGGIEDVCVRATPEDVVGAGTLTRVGGGLWRPGYTSEEDAYLAAFTANQRRYIAYMTYFGNSTNTGGYGDNYRTASAGFGFGVVDITEGNTLEGEPITELVRYQYGTYTRTLGKGFDDYPPVELN
jgi:hypothetical protein